MKTQLVRNFTNLRDIVHRWDELSCNALEPNVFYESWALLPACEHLAEQEGSVAILLIWADDDHKQLAGLFPLMRESNYRKLPAAHWTNWLHLHSPLGNPLIHRDYPRQTLEEFFNWVETETDAMVFSLKQITADGPLHHYLRDFLQQKGCLLDSMDTWERALLHSPLSVEEYMSAHFRKKKLKEFRRLHRRLEELGEITVETLMPGDTDNLYAWVRDFFRLEESGWKGKSHTALSCHENERLFAEGMIRNAAAQGQLMMLKMSLNGEPIAMKLNFLAATQNGAQSAFALKIAYDEQYAPYSPGVLLELENIRAVLDHSHIDWMDSCAIPDHPMINHLWHERRKICSLHISTKHLFSKPILHTMRFVKSVYQFYAKG